MLLSVKRICFLVVAAFLAGHAVADSRETVEMNDGTVYEGYISSQYRNGDITISSDNTVGTVPSEMIDRIVSRSVSVPSLSLPWREYLGKDVATVELTDIYLKDSAAEEVEIVEAVAVVDTVPVGDVLSVEPDTAAVVKKPSGRKKGKSKRKKQREVLRNVMLLEHGAYVKYITFEPSLIDEKTSNISSITRRMPPKESLSGVKDVIVTKDGSRYSGHIVATYPGRHLSVNTGNMVRNIRYADIVSTGIEFINPEISPFRQSPYLNTVVFSDGTIVNGIMTSQNSNSGEITVLTADKASVVRKNKDVKQLKKSPNPDYRIITDIIIDSDTAVYAGREPLKLTKMMKVNDGMAIDLKNAHFNRVKVDADRQVEIEVKESVTNQRWALLPVAIKANSKSVKIPFSYMVDNTILPVATDVSPNGTLKITFKNLRQGNYVLINSQKMQSAIITLSSN